MNVNGVVEQERSKEYTRDTRDIVTSIFFLPLNLFHSRYIEWIPYSPRKKKGRNINI
jgi:hypothetical protein